MSTESCWNSFGNQDLTRYPCSQDGDPAQCCGEGEICSSNGLCLHQHDDGRTTYWLNTCSNPEWANGTAPTCPLECSQYEHRGGNGIQDCGTGTYCCNGYMGCDCNNATLVFTLGTISAVTTITIPTSTSTSTDTSTTSSSTTISTNDSSSHAPTTPTSTQTSIADPALKSAAGAETGTASTSENNPQLGIGLGVGLGVGIPLIIGSLAGLWLIRRRRHRRCHQHRYGIAGAGHGRTGAPGSSFPDKGWEQVVTAPVPVAQQKQRGPPQELSVDRERARHELQ
ncbi:hypothetical protein BJX62DRAFT_246643 [Aspergillus germanicus]